MTDVIQEQVCDCNGVQALMRLLEPAQMDHGEEAMVNTAAKLLSIIQENGKLFVTLVLLTEQHVNFEL